MNNMQWKKHTRYAVATVAGSHPFTTFLSPFPEGQKIAREIEENVRKRGRNIQDVIREITEWVHEHIIYESDILNYGEEDYFASPRLTLERGTGDCEDESFLIASMLNSLRVKPKTVYVTVGLYKNLFNPTSYHAWTYVEHGIIAEGTAGYIAVKGEEKYKNYHPMFGIQKDAIHIFWPISKTEKALGISAPLQIDVAGQTIDLLPMLVSVAAPVAASAAVKGGEMAYNYAKQKKWVK